MSVLVVSRSGVQTFLILVGLFGGSECLGKGQPSETQLSWEGQSGLSWLWQQLAYFQQALTGVGCQDCNVIAFVISHLWLFFECYHTTSLPQPYKLGTFIFISFVDKITERRLAIDGLALSSRRVGQHVNQNLGASRHSLKVRPCIFLYVVLQVLFKAFRIKGLWTQVMNSPHFKKIPFPPH